MKTKENHIKGCQEMKKKYSIILKKYYKTRDKYFEATEKKVEAWHEYYGRIEKCGCGKNNITMNIGTKVWKKKQK